MADQIRGSISANGNIEGKLTSDSSVDGSLTAEAQINSSLTTNGSVDASLSSSGMMSGSLSLEDNIDAELSVEPEVEGGLEVKRTRTVATMLSELADVELEDLQDDDILVYDSMDRKWHNVENTGGGGSWGTITGDIEDQTDLQDALDAKISSSEKGANNGVATLDATGRVPSAQLPSYVDDILEYASVSAFPAIGEAGKIYVALDTNKMYRWSGSTYVEVSESLALGETTGTAYEGSKGKANADNIAALQGLVPSSASTSNKLATANDIPSLTNYVQKSQTAGLLKNDGSVDTTHYVSDISGKADKTDAYLISDSPETDLDDDDYIPFYDDSASAKKNTVWSNIKDKLRTFFSGLFVAKSGDVMTGTIRRDIPGRESTTYIQGCGGASGLHINKAEGDIYYTAVSMRTKTGGGWAVGNYNNDNLQFAFGEKSDIESETNNVQIVNLRPTGGTLALTSEIPSTYAGSDSAGGKATSAKVADHVKYEAGNEINFSGGAQTTCWFNYRNADTGSSDAVSAMVYKFANYSNDVSKTTLQAASFSGNAATASALKDSNNGVSTTAGYSKSNLNYGDYSYLAAWNGYELRCASKAQFLPGNNIVIRYLTASVTVSAGSWNVVSVTEESISGWTIFMTIYADVNNASIVPVNIVGRSSGGKKQFYVRNLAGSSQTATITVAQIFFRS